MIRNKTKVVMFHCKRDKEFFFSFVKYCTWVVEKEIVKEGKGFGLTD